MVAAVDSSNGRAIEFHARLGFGEVARMPGIGDKWGQRLDLVLLQKALLTILADDDETDGRPTAKGLISWNLNAKSWNLNAWN